MNWRTGIFLFDTVSILCSPKVFKYQRRKKAKFANGLDLDEVAHNEPPHLDLHCLPSRSLNSQYNIAWSLHFLKICRRTFCRQLLAKVCARNTG